MVAYNEDIDDIDEFSNLPLCLDSKAHPNRYVLNYYQSCMDSMDKTDLLPLARTSSIQAKVGRILRVMGHRSVILLLSSSMSSP